MTEIFVALAQNVGVGIAVVCLLFCAAVAAIVFVVNWRGKYRVHESRISAVEGEVKDVQPHEARLCTIETDVKDLRQDVKNVQQNVANIEGATKTILALISAGGTELAQAHSPVRLTDKGEMVAKEINASQIFDKYAEALIDTVETQKPLSAYDIQVAAFNVAATELPQMLNATEMAQMKDVAFNTGQILEQMWIVFGILLRDKILEIRRIDVSELDDN